MRQIDCTKCTDEELIKFSKQTLMIMNRLANAGNVKTFNEFYNAYLGELEECERRLSPHRWHRFDDPDNPPPKDKPIIALRKSGKFIVIKYSSEKENYCWWNYNDLSMSWRESEFTHYMLITPPEADHDR